MPWYQVLVQGTVVKEKLQARGKTPSNEIGMWGLYESISQKDAELQAIQRYGRPAFVKQVIQKTEAEAKAIIGSNERFWQEVHAESVGSLDTQRGTVPLASNPSRFAISGAGVYVPAHSYKFDLSLSMNPIGASERVREIITSIHGEVHNYPDPNYTSLVTAISEKYEIDPEMIIIGAGVDGLLEDVTRSLIDPGQTVVLPELSFLNIAFATEVAGGVPSYVSMLADLHINFQGMKDAVTDETKIVFLCNPNNPTGLSEKRESILSLTSSNNALVVVDEANIEFGGETLTRDVLAVPNLMVLRTFSKAYGLAGLRVGFGVGPKHIVSTIKRLRPPFPVTTISEIAAVSALKDPSHVEKVISTVKSEREFLEGELTLRKFKVVSSVSNCFVARVPEGIPSSTHLIHDLNQLDANLVDGKFFRGLGDRFVRVSPRCNDTNKAFLQILDTILAGCRR